MTTNFSAVDGGAISWSAGTCGEAMFAVIAASDAMAKVRRRRFMDRTSLMRDVLTACLAGEIEFSHKWRNQDAFVMRLVTLRPPVPSR
jgi:hypothetical protein